MRTAFKTRITIDGKTRTNEIRSVIVDFLHDESTSRFKIQLPMQATLAKPIRNTINTMTRAERATTIALLGKLKHVENF